MDRRRLLIGSRSHLLPYTSEIEYLEVTANGPYIDTGFYPTYKTRVVADVQTAGVHGFLFGARATSSSTSPNQFVFGVTGTTGIRTDYFGTTKTASVGSTTVRTVIDKNANVTTAFGVTTTNTAVSSGVVYDTMYIFIFNNAGVPASSYGLMKLYSFKIYNNDGSLARDYIPVRVGSEGALYDKVNGELYYNAGTGAFVLGPDIASDSVGTKTFYIEMFDGTIYTYSVPEDMTWEGFVNSTYNNIGLYIDGYYILFAKYRYISLPDGTDVAPSDLIQQDAVYIEDAF